MDQGRAEPFRIGLLGPAGVGKTSLVTAMLAESQLLLAGSGVAMHPVGKATSDRIARNQFMLDGARPSSRGTAPSWLTSCHQRDRNRPIQTDRKSVV